MKNILIIYPHWHPVNLAGVHRPRLIGNFLPDFGWHPIVLTVKEECFEEKPDYDFEKTFKDHYEVYRTDAFKITKPRLIGDIALRAFFQLYKKALQIIKEKEIDFIWIPIPSFYTAILGRLIYNKTKIPYGIDYIDPWINQLNEYQGTFSRAWFSQLIAKILEPYSVKKAALITGVSESYYADMLDRNFKNKKIQNAGMPYGFDPFDHTVELKGLKFPWNDDDEPYVYAGAFLPHSHMFMKAMFRSLDQIRQEMSIETKKMHFLGTGYYPGITIKEISKDYNVADRVNEIQDRFPFLEILNFLAKAKGVIVIGSTEKHYTASKIFQSLLSKRPVFAVFHEESSVVEILKEVNGDQYLVKYSEGDDFETMVKKIKPVLYEYLFNPQWNPNLSKLDKYSSKASCQVLVENIEKVI